MSLRILIGIQARSGSKRLPGKIYLPLLPGKTVLDCVYDKCRFVEFNGHVITTKILGHAEDFKLKDYCEKRKLPYQLIGNENDVLTRYVTAGKQYDAVVRVTSDCPMIPTNIIKQTIRHLNGVDYVTNVSPRTFPDGWDCQAIKSKALEWVDGNSGQREHCFNDLDNNPAFLFKFSSSGYSVRRLLNSCRKILNPYHPDNKCSIDTQEDVARVKKWIDNGGPFKGVEIEI